MRGFPRLHKNVGQDSFHLHYYAMSHTNPTLILLLLHFYANDVRFQGASTGHGSSTGSSTESAPKRTTAEGTTTQVKWRGWTRWRYAVRRLRELELDVWYVLPEVHR